MAAVIIEEVTGFVIHRPVESSLHPGAGIFPGTIDLFRVVLARRGLTFVVRLVHDFGLAA
jgi:hypothetical protein